MNKIEKIHASPYRGVVIETGAGAVIAHELLSVIGASNTVISTHVPYSKEYVDSFGYAYKRAISTQYLDVLEKIYNKGVRETFLSLPFFEITTSFQIKYNPNETTHGWIKMTTYAENTLEGKTKYYHISLPNTERIKQIHNIGKIAIDIMYNETCGADEIIEGVDIILSDKDERLNILNYLKKSKYNRIVLFRKDGTTDRIESITRNGDLIIFKGSFNPPTIAHEQGINVVDGNKYFSISLDTVGKGWQDNTNVLHRIKMLNLLGYDVMVNNRPKFIEIKQVLDPKMNGKLHIILGEDTYERLGIDYGPRQPKDAYEKDFGHNQLHVLRRNSYKEYLTKAERERFKELTKNNTRHYDVYTTSSTQVREGDISQVTEKIKEYIIENKLYGY